MTKTVRSRYTLEFKQEAVRLVHIKAIQSESKGGYGWPRLWKALVARSIRVGTAYR